ncbi:MAG: hypothetical protein ABIO70_07795, partial [Pseudomonadota bacterium]
PGLGLDLDGWYAAEPAILRLLDAPEEDPRFTVAQLRDALARATGRSLTTPDPARYQRAIDVTLELLATAVQPLVRTSDDPRDAQARQTLASLEQARTNPPAPLAPEACAYLNRILLAQVHGRLFHRLGGLPRALGLLLVETRMARAASNDGRSLDAAQLAVVLVPWWSLAGHGAVVAALRMAAPTLEDLFIHA